MSKQPESVASPLPLNLLAPTPSQRPLPRPASVASAHGNLRYVCPNSRWRALSVGVAFALLLHAGLFFSDRFGAKAPLPVRSAQPPETIIQLEMPHLEPDKPEEVVDMVDESAAPQLAPPTLADIPKTIPIDAFTQPLSPPSPPGIVIGKNAFTIPLGPPGSGFGKGIQNLFNIDNLDQRPVLKVTVPPDYPPDMLRTGVSGAVRVEFIIDSRGEVIDVQVVDSSHSSFETPAVRALQRWKFRPGRKNGKSVNTRVAQVVNFNIEDYQERGALQ